MERTNDVKNVCLVCVMRYFITLVMSCMQHGAINDAYVCDFLGQCILMAMLNVCRKVSLFAVMLVPIIQGASTRNVLYTCC